ncbi:MAG: hypothetical protein Q8S73_03155 [Deltaproteobacteria bacterium]|nr:hypothetical protein [Myxococcales bacterium]MDP3213078.1 hypothetical protein [Deltaproteobacteria bacterium]
MSEIIRVLRYIRDRGPVGEEAIIEEFHPRSHQVNQAGTEAFRTQSRMSAHLGSLLAAGLVVLRPGGNNREMLYCASPLVGAIQGALGISLADLIGMQSRHPDAVQSLRCATAELERLLPPSGYRAHLIATMMELTGCVDRGFYSAAMALAGKVLEICLKERLLAAGVAFDDNWMLGTLLSRVKDLPGAYLDPSLANVANIIKENRNPAVHARQEVPLPSPEQALVVTNAVLDVLRKKLLTYGPTALPPRAGQW